jgi:hypothetical protein
MSLIRFVLSLTKRFLDQRHASRNIWTIMLCGGLLLASCMQSEPRVERLFQLFIQPSDLPAGWYHDAGGIGELEREEEGIFSRWVQFRRNPEREAVGVLVSQELVDYPTVEQAVSAYDDIIETLRPVEEWRWPDEIAHDSQADRFSVACMQDDITLAEVDRRYVGMYNCNAVGQYGHLVSIIYANVFQNQWLTFEDLQRLLNAADRRLATGQP